MRVLIADDHAIFRRGLKETLAEQFKKITFGEAKSAQEALEQVRKHKWELVILDISMPGGKSGLDIVGEIHDVQPKLPVLLLSMHPEEQFARRALKSGAAGYLTKESVPEELTRAVRRALTGRRYVSEMLAEKLAWDLDAPDKPLHELLSNREFQVLRMIASGKTAKEVASELFLSVKTVSTYRGRILEKTGMRNNAELIRYAVENHLVE